MSEKNKGREEEHAFCCGGIYLNAGEAPAGCLFGRVLLEDSDSVHCLVTFEDQILEDFSSVSLRIPHQFP